MNKGNCIDIVPGEDGRRPIVERQQLTRDSARTVERAVKREDQLGIVGDEKSAFVRQSFFIVGEAKDIYVIG